MLVLDAATMSGRKHSHRRRLRPPRRWSVDGYPVGTVTPNELLRVPVAQATSNAAPTPVLVRAPMGAGASIGEGNRVQWL